MPYEPIPDDWSGIAPVFPLPNTVFFPQTTLPLHVFEPRYRQMVEDASAGEGLIVVSLLRGEWQKDYVGSPSIHPMATVGRMRDVQRLPDGRYNMQLDGITRVRLTEMPCDRMYRIAEVVLAGEPDVLENESRRRDKVDLLAAHAYLIREMTDDDSPQLPLDHDRPYAAAVNHVCARLPVDPAVRQQLLEIDDLCERLRLAQRLVGDLLERVLQLKSSDDTDGSPVN